MTFVILSEAKNPGILAKSEHAVGGVWRLITLALLVMLLCGMAALSALDVRAADPPQIPISRAPELLKLADEAGFKTKDLTACERKLLQSAPIGEFAFCQSDDDKENDPSKGDKWPASRQIRAELIRWLCVNEAARKLIDPKGIEIDGAKVIDPLDLDFISEPFPILIIKSRIISPMLLRNASIEGLSLMGTWTGPITADGLTTRGDIFLNNGFHADGEVRLLGASVGGDLDCENGTFSNPNGKALDADSIKVVGSVFLRNGFNAEGEIHLLGATVGGNLEAENGTFSNPKGKALSADHSKVAGSIFLRQATATGEVRLLGATVGGDLDCYSGTFRNPKGYALNADGSKVAGSIFLRQATATGEVRLLGATVGGDLDCGDATFAPGSELKAERARISGTFWWTKITHGSKSTQPDHKSPDVELDLIGASAASVVDDEASWPATGKLLLDGFTYERFERPDTVVVPHDADSRLRWLHRQDPAGGLATQPYEQLAKVLEGEGDERGARQVRIAMEDDLLPKLPWRSYLWRQILRVTVAYGYKPWIALYWALGFVLYGYLSFAFGYRAGVIAPTDKEASAKFQSDATLLPGYQPFNAFTYSLDTFLPIINLGLKDQWMPDPNIQPRSMALAGTWLGDRVGAYLPRVAHWRFFNSGRALRVYFWCHLLLGWVLITLFAAGFTGIIRR